MDTNLETMKLMLELTKAGFTKEEILAVCGVTTSNSPPKTPTTSNPSLTEECSKKTYSLEDLLQLAEDDSQKNCKATSGIMSKEEFLALSDAELEELDKRSPYNNTHQFEYFSCSTADRADESKLRKIGYSVAKNSGQSDSYRQALLQNAIEHDILTKGYVIALFESLIKINGSKENNHVAVYKWKKDLEFVRKL